MSVAAENWLQLLQGAVAEAGSIQGVATALGYSRTAISLVLRGCYGGDTRLIAAAVTERYAPAHRCLCPHLGHEIPISECRVHRARPMPQGDPAELRHWAACRICPLHQPQKESADHA